METPGEDWDRDEEEVVAHVSKVSDKSSQPEEECRRDLRGLDPMQLGPQVPPCQLFSPGQKLWISKMRQLQVFLGPEELELVGFTDPGADLSSLHVSLVDVGVPCFLYPIKAFEGDVIRQPMVFQKIRIGQFSAMYPFLLHTKEQISILVGADLLYKSAQCAKDPIPPEEIFPRIVGEGNAKPRVPIKVVELETEPQHVAPRDLALPRSPELHVGDTVSVLCVAAEGGLTPSWKAPVTIMRKIKGGQCVIQGPLEGFQHPQLIHEN